MLASEFDKAKRVLKKSQNKSGYLDANLIVHASFFSCNSFNIFTVKLLNVLKKNTKFDFYKYRNLYEKSSSKYWYKLQYCWTSKKWEKWKIKETLVIRNIVSQFITSILLKKLKNNP